MTKIYTLSDPITNTIMYVGKTKARLSARMGGHYHCSRHGNTPRDVWIKQLKDNNLKPIYNIIEDVPDEIWREKEIYWIAFYKNINPNLKNLTVGGEGVTGYIRTEESKISMSERQSKKVYQLDKNYKILNKYSSCKEAENIFSITSVSRAAKSKGRFIRGGFVWIYVDDYELIKDNLKDKFHKKDSTYLYKKICQYDKHGNFIKGWDGAVLAAKQLNISRIGISKAATGYRKTYKGFIWKTS